MKITPFLFACCVALLLSVAPRAARAEDVTFDVFYNSLSDDGEWYNTPEYGYVFQPDVAFNNDKWRPYTDGYWAQTEDGWTWVAYEEFGWATYHYGRWTRLKDTGWVWVPGYEWGPGWVSWRTSDDKVGWAPLPPKANIAYVDGKDVTEEAPRTRVSVDYSDVEEDYATGYTPAVDEDYDIGPENYCFVETRRFGDPRLSEVLLPPTENVIYVENSTNVTYISYQNDRGRRFIYNRGPDYGFIRGRSERPIQELRLERHDDVDFLRNGRGRGGNANRVQDGVLQVASPAISRRPMDFQQVRPNKVKRNLDKPQVLRGWQGVQAKDPALATRLRDSIKQQARQPVAPGAASAGRLTKIEAQAPAPAAPPAPAPAQGAAAPVPPAQLKNLTEQDRAARRAARQAARAQGGAPAQAPGATPPAPGAVPDQDKAARKAARQAAREQGVVPPPGQPGQPNQPPTVNPDKAARRAARQAAAQQQVQPQPNGDPSAPQPPPPAAVNPDKAARKAARQAAAQQQQQAQPQPNAAPQPQPPAVDPDKAARKAARQAAAQQQAQQAQQQQAVPPQNPQQDQEKAARRAARQQQQQQQQQAPQPQQGPSQQAQDAARAARQAQRQQAQQQQQQQQQRPQAQAPQPRREERAPRPQSQQAQPQPQQQAQPQAAAGDDKKKKDKDR